MKVGTLRRLRLFAMAPAIATDHINISHSAVPCEVLNASGHWISGYELLHFCDNGLLTIRSTHTGDVEQLPPERWRDPVEEAVLNAISGRF